MLAEASDVEAMLGRSLSESELTRVDGLLVLASSEVEAVTRRRFEPGDYTVTRAVRGGRVRLPAASATVTEVREVNPFDGSEVVTTGYTVRAATVYGLSGYEVAVDFTTAAAVPDPVVKVVAGMVSATIESPPVGVSAEAAGPFQRSFVASSGRVWLSKSDREILAAYTIPKPAISL